MHSFRQVCFMRTTRNRSALRRHSWGAALEGGGAICLGSSSPWRTPVQPNGERAGLTSQRECPPLWVQASQAGKDGRCGDAPPGQPCRGSSRSEFQWALLAPWPIRWEALGFLQALDSPLTIWALDELLSLSVKPAVAPTWHMAHTLRWPCWWPGTLALESEKLFTYNLCDHRQVIWMALHFLMCKMKIAPTS